MTKEDLKAKYEEFDGQIEFLKDASEKLKVFIHGSMFRELSDLEATLVMSEHHQIEGLARTILMLAALFGGRLQDPDGTRATVQVNNEVPNKVLVPEKPDIQVGHSVRVGDTVITEG